MNKLAVFFRTFWRSISSFSYYHDVVKARFSFSLKYFLFFSFLLGIFLTAVVSLVVVPPVNDFLTRFKARAHTLYPADLIVTIKDGQLATNASEPLHFPIPFELFTSTPPAFSDQKQIYMLTIDTSAQVEDFTNSQSILLITKDNMVVQDDRGGYRVYPLKDIEDFTLDKAQTDKMLEKILPLLNYVTPFIIVILVLVFLILLPVSRLFSLLFLSLLLLLAARLMRLNFNFSKIYQIGLHSLTLPTLIQFLMTALGLVPPIPFFTSILFLLYTLVILAQLREKSPTTTTQLKTPAAK